MKIILFGSGQGGRMAARWLPADKTLLAFADSDPRKQGTALDGVPVVAPEEIPALAPDLVWITVLNREAAASIEARLRALGCEGPIETLNPFRERMDLRLAQVRLMAEEINAAGLPGAVAELGVYQGSLAAELNRLFPDRTLYLFDTFSGFSQADVEAERRLSSHTRALAGDFADTSVRLVREKLPHPEKAVFCQGLFPETLPEDLPPLAFVSLDPDLYQPALLGLRAFWPRLVPGGAVLIHDYNSAQFPGAGRAVRRFCLEQGLMAIPLADLHGSAILFKQK